MNHLLWVYGKIVNFDISFFIYGYVYIIIIYLEIKRGEARFPPYTNESLCDSLPPPENYDEVKMQAV